MPTDKYEILGSKYNEIGAELVDIVGGTADGIYLYAEAGDGWFGYSVFKDEGSAVRYFTPTSELGDLIRDAWKTENRDRQMRWAIMEYEIKDGKFEARFKYPEEVDVESFDIDRREEALKRRYGDKPVIYPPIPDHFLEIKADED